MKRLLLAIAASLGLAMAATVPASATPAGALTVKPGVTGVGHVEQVRHRRYSRHRWRHHRRHHRRHRGVYLRFGYPGYYGYGVPRYRYYGRRHRPYYGRSYYNRRHYW